MERAKRLSFRGEEEKEEEGGQEDLTWRPCPVKVLVTGQLFRWQAMSNKQQQPPGKTISSLPWRWAKWCLPHHEWVPAFFISHAPPSWLSKGLVHMRRAIQVFGQWTRKSRPLARRPDPLSLAVAPFPAQDMLEWLTIKGGPPPPPKTKVTTVGKNDIYHWKHLVGPFLVHKLSGPSPAPPPPLIHRCSHLKALMGCRPSSAPTYCGPTRFAARSPGSAGQTGAGGNAAVPGAH